MLIYVISIFKKIAIINGNFMVVNVGMTKCNDCNILILIPVELFILFLFFAVYKISCNGK